MRVSTFLMRIQNCDSDMVVNLVFGNRTYKYIELVYGDGVIYLEGHRSPNESTNKTTQMRKQRYSQTFYTVNDLYAELLSEYGDTELLISCDGKVSSLFNLYTDRDYLYIESTSSGKSIKSNKKLVKCSVGEDYVSSNPDIIEVLEANGFEYANDATTPWWDKFMWFGFGCTYNDDTKEAYVWWNPNGNLYELPFNYDIQSVADANDLCDDLYDWDEYNIDELLNAGLPLIGATSHNNKLDEWDYDNGMGDVAYINTALCSGYVIDAYGDKIEYNNLQDLLEAASIIR